MDRGLLKKMKAYRYRVYATKEQAKAIDETIEKCRLLHNELLALKKNVYTQKGINLSRKDLYLQVKGNKEMHSQVSQNVVDKLDICQLVSFVNETGSPLR